MKKCIMLVLSFVLLFSVAGCGAEQKADTETLYETEAPVNLDRAKELYPEFFEIEGEPFKGVEVYVWQMAEKSYYCGLMFGTNRNKTDEEILNLQNKALTLDETKAMLDAIGVPSQSVLIYPIAQPYSSYMYEVDENYRNEVQKLFK